MWKRRRLCDGREAGATERDQIKFRLTDWLLCVLITIGLTAAVCVGLKLQNTPLNNALLFFCGGGMTAAFLLLSYRAILLVAGLIAAGVTAFDVVLYATGSNPLDSAGARGTLLFVLILFVAAFLVFLLTRTRAGTVLLFLWGSVCCAGANFLGYTVPLWSLALFELSVFAAYLYRVWFTSVRRGGRGALYLGRNVAQIAALCLAGLALAAGVYFAVVRPLAPPTREAQLRSLLRSTELLRLTGGEQAADPSETEPGGEGPEVPRSDGDTEVPAAEPETQTRDAGEEPAQLAEPSDPTPGDGGTGNSLGETRRPGWEWRYWPWLLLVAPLGLGCACGVRLYLRRRWFRAVRAMPPAEGAVNCYRFLLSRLARAGFPKDPGQTPREYAAARADSLAPYAAGEGGFRRLTEIYERAGYGGGPVSEAEYRLLDDACAGFCAAHRRRIGPVRYYLTLFKY